MSNLEDLVVSIENQITKALDICAPLKTFKVRENHKFGISDSTKKLIKERNAISLNLSKLSPSECIIQHGKYKKLRNRINSLVKNDTIKYNNERVEAAKDENEMWKIVKDIKICCLSAHLGMPDSVFILLY